MRLGTVPAFGARYWVAISIASVFGANLGDFVSHQLHLGHLRGLPVLAILFAGVLAAERRPALAGELWYWAAIVLLRTAATNLADLATHDLRLAYPGVIAALFVLLGALAAIGQRTQAGRPATDPWYWAAMLTAGTLGTAIGDYFNDALGLGAGLGTLVLVPMLALTLYAGSLTNWAGKLAYWGSIVAVRSAGTTFGDFLPGRHGLALGLPLSTALTGLALVLTLALWRPRSAQPRPDRVTAAETA